MKFEAVLWVQCVVGVAFIAQGSSHSSGHHTHINVQVNEEVEDWDFYRSVEEIHHKFVRREADVKAAEVFHHKFVRREADVKAAEVCEPEKCIPQEAVYTAASLSETARVVKLGSTLTLPCHLCESKPSSGPKIWLKFARLLDVKSDEILWQPREVRLDTHDNERLNRVYDTAAHALIIEDFQQADIGTYFCVDYEPRDPDSENRRTAHGQWAFTSPAHHELSAAAAGVAWAQQSRTTDLSHMTHVDVEEWAVEKLVSSRYGAGYALVSKPLVNEEANWKAFTAWASWGKCTLCGSSGERQRRGTCMVKVLDAQKPASPAYLDHVLHLYPAGAPCHSSLFTGHVSAAIMERPKETEVGTCPEACDEGFSNKKLGIDLTVGDELKNSLQKAVTPTVIVVTEKDPLVLVCRGVDKMAAISWLNGTKTLTNGSLVQETLGRIQIPMNHTFLFVWTEAWDNGNYSCWHDERCYFLAQVTVTPKKVIINRSWEYFGILCVFFMGYFVIFLIMLIVQHWQRMHQTKRRKRRRRRGRRGKDVAE